MPLAPWRAILAVLLLFCPAAAPARALPRIAPAVRPTAAGGDRLLLTPGQYLWYANFELPQAGGVAIVVSIPSQLAYVYRDGALIGVSTVSTGRRGKETPLGTFAVLEKQWFHRSNKYSNAPMPFMQRLTWDGIALHGGHLPGYPASHGCIRMPDAFARQLYDLTRLGASVTVTDRELLEPGTNPFTPAQPRFAAPLLVADVRELGGEAFNVVTMRDASAPVEAPVAPAGAVQLAPRPPIEQAISYGG